MGPRCLLELSGCAGTSKVSTESLDKPLQGLESRAIDAAQVLICCHPDGSEWVLGQGSFGTVSPACALTGSPCPVHDHGLQAFVSHLLQRRLQSEAAGCKLCGQALRASAPHHACCLACSNLRTAAPARRMPEGLACTSAT